MNRSKLITAVALSAALATGAGCGAKGATTTVTAPAKTITIPAAPINNTVYKTPQVCKTALYRFRHIAQLELNAIKKMENFDYSSATGEINKATAMVDKVIAPYTKCLTS